MVLTHLVRTCHTYYMLYLMLERQEFCAPWKRKRGEEAEKQLEAATALAEAKQEHKQAQEALAAEALAEQAALGGGGGAGREGGVGGGAAGGGERGSGSVNKNGYTLAVDTKGTGREKTVKS